MTTSDPRADHRDDRGDDHPGEHRGLGKRILDAVLGEPGDHADDRTGHPTTARSADPGAAGATGGRPTGVPGSFSGDGPHGEPTSYEQAMRDAPPAGAGPQAHDTRFDARRDAGHDPSENAHDAQRDAGVGSVVGGPTDTRRDTGYDPSGAAHDARRDAGYDSGAQPAGHGPGRDPLAPDAPHDLESARGDDRRPADRSADAGVAGPAADRGAGPDFVTGSYDPGRDTGYDPHTAGTAVETDPARGPVARTTHGDTDRDTDRDYDPAQDTGYVDPARAEADRTTGRRDDDYDTGRVDRSGGRVATEPVGTDQPADDRGGHRGAAAGAAGAAGVAAAAAFGSTHHDRTDRDADSGIHSDTHSGAGSRDSSFSEVDDTTTVDATDTGRGTPDTGAVAGQGQTGVAGQGQAGVSGDDGSAGGRERLVPADRAADYSSRWDALKGDFVDEPRRAVRSADELVGEVLDELQRLFADQRRDLEQSFDHDQASTEDLRLALRRYRSFFDRLLSF